MHHQIPNVVLNIIIMEPDRYYFAINKVLQYLILQYPNTKEAIITDREKILFYDQIFYDQTFYFFAKRNKCVQEQYFTI
ncbi:putative ORFan [Tupanvirus deep ocean]|uniref:ORFan n=1 Tax=Tupanvirus soda lake TaxID=2126985 RepID=A0AC59HBU6_9VIRU|nr:putative ORFan [Tupanvirus deep ocean]AUL79230.2 putative ORFan [Tupanvirus deep ocean]